MQQRKSLRQYSENKEQQVTHNTYALEREIYDLIASGDVEKLKTFFANPQNFHHLNEGPSANAKISSSGPSQNSACWEQSPEGWTRNRPIR